MKVCMDLNPFLYQPTGVGYYIKGLFTNLCLLDKEDMQLCGLFSSYKYKVYLDKVKSNIINLKIPSKMFNYILYRLQIPIVEILLMKRFNIMHSPQAIVMPAIKAKKIITIHDLYFYKNGGEGILGNKDVDRRYVKKSIKLADRIICISNYTYNELIDLFPECISKSIVIYPGYDYQDKDDAEKNIVHKKVLRNGIKLPEDYLIFVGTIEERKNLLPLVDAISNLNKKGVKIELLIAGKAGYKGENVFERIKSTRNIRYLGYITEDEKKILYKNAKILVMPSKEEGFGIPILEAMNYGIPVIATKGSALEEIGREAVYLLNSTESEEIMNSIVRVLEDNTLREKLIKKGYERCKMFNWKETANKVYQEYVKLLS